MTYKIRKLISANEIDEVVKIVDTALQEDFPTYKSETILVQRKKIYTKDYFTKLFANKANCIFGAFITEQLAGFIVLKTDVGGVVFIDWLAVKKEHRKKGLGSQLLDKAKDWALAHQYHFLYLYTETPTNIPYYQKRGFTHAGTLSGSWFGEDEQLMTKNLREKPFEEVFKL